jgi:enoyl-CoA hydratase/carnithine racemase
VHGKERTKPTVIAVHGRCLTLGIELCLAQDVVVAATSTRFAQIEIKRGIFPFGGATYRFIAAAGWGNASIASSNPHTVTRDFMVPSLCGGLR